jgi:hypothetical protein
MAFSRLAEPEEVMERRAGIISGCENKYNYSQVPGTPISVKCNVEVVVLPSSWAFLSSVGSWSFRDLPRLGLYWRGSVLPN